MLEQVPAIEIIDLTEDEDQMSPTPVLIPALRKFFHLRLRPRV